MKFSTILATAMVVGMGAASAADLPRQPRAPAPVSYDPIWTSPYVGIHLGADFGRDGNSSVDKGVFTLSPFVPGDFTGGTGIDSARNSKTSFAGGAQLGYNYQIDENIVFGAVVDVTVFNRSNDRAIKRVANAYRSATLDTLDYTDSFKQVWLSTARLKAGVLLDPRLYLYATGGLAYGQLNSKSSSTTSRTESASPPVTSVELYGQNSISTALGWTAGAGLEYRMSDRWTVFGEYLYYSLKDSYDVSVTPAATARFATGGNAQTYHVNVDGSGHLGKIGVNYNF